MSRRSAGKVLADGGRVRSTKRGARSEQILQAGRLHVLVAVEDEDRQRPADLGCTTAHRRGRSLGMRLLAEDDDLVPEPRHARASERV